MVSSDQERRQGERPVPSSVAEMAALVRGVQEGSCSLIPTPHFKKRGRERDFSIQDALEVFRTGMVSPTPEWNENTNSWNHDIIGTDLEGDELTVRVAPTANKSGLVLVTAF